MVCDTILLRYGEIFLKGGNKGIFERKLVENIAKILKNEGVSGLKVRNSRGRMLMPYFPSHSALRRVFGLVSYSPAVHVEKDTAQIQAKVVQLLQGRKGTFKVSTKRSDKSFPITSPEFNRIVGEQVEKETGLRFSSSSPDVVLEIEINHEGAYLFSETVLCGGGLPTGVEGKVILLVENEASLLAGLLFMKRGCSVVPVAFEESRISDVSLLQAFSPAELKLQVVKDFVELEGLAVKKEISILVTGQVLSEETKRKTNLTIMKPLIAYSKKQIEKQLKYYKSLISN
ncbi:MAG: THUMP domain-containing protein [Nanoarchaeota archaeon]|nr:THUMP domain-containing protein [Nanoarchaeota archaeon]